MASVKDFIEVIEKRINWKVILLLFLITRLCIVGVLHTEWNGESMLCYNADCKTRWHNVESVVDGLNPYLVWKELGGYGTDIPSQSCWPPFFFILTSVFAFFWKSIWAMRLMFFLFDFLNLFLIYRLARYKNTSSVLYLLAPSLFRGLLFVEDEVFVTFLLASIYFLTKERYLLSTVMLALSFNHKFFPIVLFPVLLMAMNVVRKRRQGILPEVNYRGLLKHTGIFTLVTVFWHIFYFPDWYMFYEFRIFHYTITPGLGFGIWALLPRAYYTVFIGTAFVLFYIYCYLKKLDVKTGYLLGSLIFFSTYPRFSVDHLIFLVPLFLVWTRLGLVDILFWVFLSVTVCIDFLALPTIGLIDPVYGYLLLVLILLGFYAVIACNLRHRR
ncbi:MAG: hypothetical protein U9Q22_00330 [Candidatus Altiarchaeota archaeon]|nr:hypothetical protein [Candidatus Altiarchaeota archaeon]